MKNLPIKKGIEELLQEVRSYYKWAEGVWEIKGRDNYVKSTSELKYPPVKIPANLDLSYKEAYKAAMRCAKVYKAFIKEGIYHPKTEVVLYKDDEDNLAIMVLMPKLNTENDKIPLEKIHAIRDKFKLCLDSDMFIHFNWGCDEKGDYYAHDLHLGLRYDKILELADKMGIK